MRAVLDTNILISGIISKAGPPGFALDAWLEHELYELVTSDAQLDELRRVLTYDRLRDRIKPERAERLIERLHVAIVAEDLPDVDLSDDPDDNAIIATAIAGKAAVIVSGDKRHLVSLGDADGIPILTARQFIERLAQDHPAD
ncbi:MAG: putative toxin-antitoxin system toxin component, PIN family [Planctomycetota bacterium]